MNRSFVEVETSPICNNFMFDFGNIFNDLFIYFLSHFPILRYNSLIRGKYMQNITFF